MGKAAVEIVLTAQERSELEGLVRRRGTAQGLARRAHIVLLASDGIENKEIAARLGAMPNTVGKWRRRFAEQRLDGLYDEPRPGAPRQIGDEEIAETIRLTLETTPRDATHWSLRSMAQAVGHARGTVRISVYGRAVEHYAAMALMKRSPKITANWAFAMDHSRGG
ncbi:helix-turn-helix domain-containing protein, partial [Mesorhizobium caraganae]|nr:helix-turn-helix domain-containing protein [Mesorhizobium caraganae]